ncbi:SMI1/KNR4 family protein [Listeria sp. FSL L7-1582]|uniref:SMI1/KNR4 family protein n=1 Tax=Listeria portnoyi TaxID=2713504 RepID=UPI00164EBEEA|nr:SMI1/KNR4 family protein [Listeria portnoyi]
MEIKQDSIINPLPDSQLLSEKEKKWRIALPESYKQFIQKFSGAIPIRDTFTCNNHEYAIDRFLCILNVTGTREDEYYDIGVVRTQLDERIITDEDLIGTELLPIAVLFAGDFVCLDYREKTVEPTVCVWNHEESADLEPVTYLISENFEEFLDILKA